MINGTVVIKGPPGHAAVTVRDSNSQPVAGYDQGARLVTVLN